MSSSSLFKASVLTAVVGALGGVSAAEGLVYGDWLGFGLGLGAGMAAGLAFWNLRRAGRSVEKLVEVVTSARDGRFRCRVLNLDEDGGEIRDLGITLNDFIDRSDAFLREARASLEHVKEGKYHRRIVETGAKGAFLYGARVMNEATAVIAKRVTDFADATRSFETDVKSVVVEVEEAAQRLRRNSEQMEQSARLASHRATEVSRSADGAAGNVQTVASATEELSVSVREISSQVDRSGEIAGAAASRAELAVEAVRALDETSQRIGEVIDLITDIAEQTNLLALNATIEAARAGEAGKGFAVVANEVKHLANQTATATGDIARQIGSVQSATAQAVRAIEEINETIQAMNQASTAISAAVDQQGGATTDIARNMEHASGSTTNVREHIADVADSAETVGRNAHQVASEASDLNANAERLGSVVDGFLIAVKRVV